jgi:hypothetical protein
MLPAMGLLRIPLVPALIGCVLLWMGTSRLIDSSLPPVDTWCGSPDLGTHDHVRLRGCEISDVFYVGRSGSSVPETHWVVLSTPGSTAPSVLVEVHDSNEDRVISVVMEGLARGELDVVRVSESQASEVTRSFPEVRSAALIGESLSASTHFGTTTWIYLVFGGILLLVDAVRFGRWFWGRLMGR